MDTRISRRRRAGRRLALSLFVAAAVVSAAGEPAASPAPVAATAAEASFRLALFNIRELSTDQLADVDAHGVGRDPQARAAARIVQKIRPDVLVVQEIDQEPGAPLRNARRFADAYLATGPDPIDYPRVYSAPTNTGILSGIDLDGDGLVATAEHRGDRAHGNDSYGYGVYPGQYSMAVLSRLPLVADEARTFQRFPWRQLPGNHLPRGFYSERAVEILRLSSKAHWDLPVRVGNHRVHLWISHPTPPVFDGEDDHNGRRNFDEILFWVEYLDGGDALVDDAGRPGGHDGDAPFVIVGDLNARPSQAESVYDGRNAIGGLLRHPRIQDVGAVLTSRGGLRGHEPGPPEYPERATSDFAVDGRVDYLLPGVGLRVLGGGVFWPDPEEDPDGHALAEAASDHRLVWLDLAPRPDASGRSPAPR